MQYNFPKNFLWGAAFSGPQTEGFGTTDGKSQSIWDFWYQKDQNRFFNKMSVVGNFYQKYQEDITLAQQLKFNSLRTSIQWSRLIPDGKTVNEKAVTFYRNVWQTMLDKGIKPIVNLQHFDMPMWAQEIGGWENPEVIKAFVFYAETCFKLFSDQVKMWTTFNEPIVTVEAGYLYDMHYPNIINLKAAMQVQWNSLLAHIQAVAAFKKLNISDAKIGIILNITPALARSNNPDDLKAAEYAELFQSKCYLDPVVKNDYPKKLIELSKKYNFAWKINDEDWQWIVNKNYKVDFLGINYYTPLRVKSNDYLMDWNSSVTPHYFFQPYTMPYRRVNPYRGWEIYPKAIYLALKTIQEQYDNIPVYISENGMGVENEERFLQDNVINDDYRIEFFQEHLAWVNKAINEGSNCFGFHIWTLVDNWSWCNAYKNRYGAISLDLKTNERKLKKSAAFWQNLVTENSFEWEEID